MKCFSAPNKSIQLINSWAEIRNNLGIFLFSKFNTFWPVKVSTFSIYNSETLLLHVWLCLLQLIPNQLDGFYIEVCPGLLSCHRRNPWPTKRPWAYCMLEKCWGSALVTLCKLPTLDPAKKTTLTITLLSFSMFSSWCLMLIFSPTQLCAKTLHG